MDVNTHAASLGLDPATCHSLLRTMCSRSRSDIGDIRQALRENDRDALREAAHSIKGAAAGLDLAVLADLAARMEQAAQDEGVSALRETAEAMEREVARIESSLSDTTP